MRDVLTVTASPILYGARDDDITIVDVPGQWRDTYALDPGVTDGPLVIAPAVHHPHQLDGLPEPLPLCWVAECRERLAEGDDEVELWALSFDHDAIPLWAAATDERPASCLPCLAQVHA